MNRLQSIWHAIWRGDWLTVNRVGLLLLTLAIVSGVGGYLHQYPEGLDLSALVADFYANVSTELTSIAVTVLIIDALNRRRDRMQHERSEREQLMRALGSSVNEVARRAAEELRARGWLTDGSLQGADLRIANLEGAKLWKADLQGANLQWAKLKGANLNGSILVGANLTQANLQAARLGGADLRGAALFEARLYRVNFSGALLCDADLRRAHLEGARLIGADLRGARLDSAFLDDLTTLPDGSAWSSAADLTRFTDPSHPQFWPPQPQSDRLEGSDPT
jgi:uncharacterized protein YjbI with pentapeptide repeats